MPSLKPAPDTQHHFIELATRTLEDQPEVREEARGELMGRLAHAEEAELEGGLAQMAKVVPQRSRWAAVACWAMWLVLLGIAGWQAWRATKDGLGMNYFRQPDWEPLAAHLSAEERDFVFAKFQSRQEDVLANVERLKDLHPDDPRFYEDYVVKYFMAEKKAPPGYRETWQRLDPDNGIWALREAGRWAEEAVPRSGPVNEAAFSEAMSHFAEAGKAKHFRRPMRELSRQRIMMLAEPRGMSAELDLMKLANNEAWDGTNNYLIPLGRAVSIQADRLMSAKDREGLKALIATWEKVGAGMSETPLTLMDTIMLANFLKPSARVLENAAHSLGMADEEAELQRKQAIFSAATAASRRKADHRPMSYYAGFLTSFGGGLDPALFEPGRKMEYAMIDRGITVSSALLLLLALGGVTFEAYRRGSRVNGMAEGLAPLLRPVDGLWCLVLGLLLPLSYYFAVTRLTPLGCRDWGAIIGFNLTRLPAGWLLGPAFVQPAAGLLLVLCCLVQVTRWRIARRMAFLSLRPRWHWSAWLVPLLAALLVPLSGIARWIPTADAQLKFLTASAAATGLPLLWLLWQAVAGLGAGRERALGGVLLSRNLILPLTLPIVLLLAAWLPLKQEEHEWFLKDELTRCHRSQGGITQGEVRIAAELAKQYRSAFEPPR